MYARKHKDMSVCLSITSFILNVIFLHSFVVTCTVSSGGKFHLFLRITGSCRACRHDCVLRVLGQGGLCAAHAVVTLSQQVETTSRTGLRGVSVRALGMVCDERACIGWLCVRWRCFFSTMHVDTPRLQLVLILLLKTNGCRVCEHVSMYLTLRAQGSFSATHAVVTLSK